MSKKGRKIVIIIAILFALFYAYEFICSYKFIRFDLPNGINMPVTMVHHFDDTMTMTVRVENGWVDNGLYQIFNPIILKVAMLDKDNNKTVEISFRHADFIRYGEYREAKKTQHMSFNDFNRSKTAGINGLIMEWR